MTSHVRRRFRAPTADGAALIDPPLSETSEVLHRNRSILRQFQQASGFAASFADQARALLLDPPLLFTERKKINTSQPIVASGHQPELFHAGVWFKNFVASSIARNVSGSAANIVVDNDVVHSSAIRVPTMSSAGQVVVDVPFNAPASGTVWENWTLVDPVVFREFSAEVRRVFQPLISSSDYQSGLLLDQFWPHAVESFETQNKEFSEFAAGISALANEPATYSPFGIVRECFSSARLQLEKDLGLTLIDSPLSENTDQRPFFEFMRLLLQRHRELHEIHNRSLHEYRAVNHIRSSSHPVPELASHDGWLEIPFWLWTFESGRRRRAFMRLRGDKFEVTDREDTTVSLPVSDSAEYRSILNALRAKIRPRALITTMYARLVLSDLFVHGIGGAKYDELTDLIIRRFFGIEPPAYVTATATFRLPIERPNVSLDDVRASAQRLRELRYRAESFLLDARVKQDPDLSQRLAALAAEKRDYLAKHDLRRCSSDVFNRLDALNRAMHDLLRTVEEELRARHAELIALVRQSQLLASREFSFVLFPAEKLPARLLDLSNQIS